MFKAFIDVKSFVTVTMTIGLLVLLLMPSLEPPKEILALYCTSFGSIMTYFFTRKENIENTEDVKEVEEGEIEEDGGTDNNE